MILLERSDDETRLAALPMLESELPAERHLAARLMREFRPRVSTDAPHSDSELFEEKLTKAIAREDDEQALGAELSALAWQRLPSSWPTLLSHATHDDEYIRGVVAANLLRLSNEDEPLEDPVLDAAEVLAADPDPDISVSVFYDIAQYPHLFEPRKIALMQRAREACEHEDEYLRKEARLALMALQTGEATLD